MMFIISKGSFFRKWAYYDCQGGGHFKLDLGRDGTNPSIKDVGSRREMMAKQCTILGIYRHLSSS